MPILEACVETLHEALAAEAGGAARIELCANLREQGITPDAALLRACVARLTIPVFVMIRPRAGSFVYAPAELETMRRHIREARALGASGIVIGPLTSDDEVDRPSLQRLMEAAGDLPITFHRAFDRTRDRTLALDTLIRLGIARVLTSGGAASAVDGTEALAALARHANGRIVVMAGGQVRADNVAALVQRTGVSEVHAHLGPVHAVRAVVAQLRQPGHR